LIWTKYSKLSYSNIKAVVTKDVADFEEVNLNVREHSGGLEIFPESIQHSPNGQLLAIYDHNEYNIIKSSSFKLVYYGNCQ